MWLGNLFLQSKIISLIACGKPVSVICSGKPKTIWIIDLKTICLIKAGTVLLVDFTSVFPEIKKI